MTTDVPIGDPWPYPYQQPQPVYTYNTNYPQFFPWWLLKKSKDEICIEAAAQALVALIKKHGGQISTAGTDLAEIANALRENFFWDDEKDEGEE